MASVKYGNIKLECHLGMFLFFFQTVQPSSSSEQNGQSTVEQVSHEAR